MEKTNTDPVTNATFGLVSLLQQKPYVSDVKIEENDPVLRNMVSIWEEGSDCKLPDDLKQFYLTMNGLLVEWKIRFKENDLPIGIVEVNPIEALTGVALRLNRNDMTLQDLDIEDDEYDDQGHRKPRFHEKIFELSSDGKHGKVCLVYKEECNEDPDIWLLDLALQWHYLAPNFCQYYRMLISHLGIRGWQYLYTEFGLSPEVKQWFSYCLPHRLQPYQNLPIKDNEPSEDNKIDFNALFKQKKNTTEKKNTEQQKNKKKANQTSGTKPRLTNSTLTRPTPKPTRNPYK